MDFTYERRGSVGVFSGFTIYCQPRTEIGETFQGVLDVLEEQMDALFLCRENAPVSDGYRIVQGEKAPVYEERLDRIETGYDYLGKYYELDASLGKKALELFHRAVTFGNDTKISTYVSARVRGVVTRMGTGDRVQVRPSVVVYAFAGHLGNLTLLDRVLAETKTILSPKAQEALDRILALRGGQVPQRANELIQRLGGNTDDQGGT
ncbi:hypothetical protein [Acidithiobacillus sulfuriphilus]|uniref:Uncharacterized protein n=1 Tax=Acidithiobacillus sulfuriphilus TaxID=1867749 RepID=A0ACD5HMY4_9PROT